MPEKNKTIFFDAVGTLFEVDHGVGFQYSRIALKFGVRQEPALLDQRFYEAFKKRPPLVFPHYGTDAFEQAEKNWWRGLVRDVFEETAFHDFDLFFETLYAFFAGDGAEETPWTLFPETKSVLEHLSGLGYPLGVISNFDSRLHPVLSSLGIIHFFETITCSAQEGVAKPDAEIFKRALKKSGRRSSDAIYIGNDPYEDGVGSKSAGMAFLLVDRKKRLANQKENTIADLSEIDRFL